MINREHDLPITKQAATLNVNRGSVYYLPRPVSTAHLTLVRRIDELHLEFPFAGSRRLRDLAPDGAPDPGARSDQQPGLTEEAGSAVASMKTDDPCKLDAPIVAYYGSYTVDEAGKKIFGKIEAASYSPRANMETIWTVQGSGDKLTFILSLRKDQHSSYPRARRAARNRAAKARMSTVGTSRRFAACTIPEAEAKPTCRGRSQSVEIDPFRTCVSARFVQ